VGLPKNPPGFLGMYTGVWTLVCCELWPATVDCVSPAIQCNSQHWSIFQQTIALHIRGRGRRRTR